jgi:hypothetical protein
MRQRMDSQMTVSARRVLSNQREIIQTLNKVCDDSAKRERERITANNSYL